MKAQPGSQQRGSCSNSRHREETTTALYLPNISVSHMKLDFLRACISLPRSQGWRHPSEKHRGRQRERQRYFSITEGVSRLQQNFSLLSLLPLSLKLFMLCRAQHLVNPGAENKQGAVPATRLLLEIPHVHVLEQAR